LAFHGLLLTAIGLLGLLRLRANKALPSSIPSGNPIAGKTEWETWTILATLSALALGLRLWRLNSCFWYDELITLLDFVRPPLVQIITSFQSQNQHMLYSILAHLSIRIFGESAWALRLPSVLFGTASLWAVFFLGRRLTGNREALLACALLTVSYHHIWFSQNARGYMGLMLFATLATWLWLEAQDRGTWGWWTLYALALFAGLWIHLTMVFVPAAHALVFLLAQWRTRVVRRRDAPLSLRTQLHWKAVAAWFLCGTLTLQAYALAWPEFLRVAAREGVATRTEWTHPLWVIQEMLRGLEVGWLGVAVVLCGGVLALLGWLNLLGRDWQAALLMVLPSLLGAATMLALGHPLWPRFFFFSMGFALLILVRGTIEFPRVVLAFVKARRPHEGWWTRVGFALAAVLVAVSAATVPRNYAFPKQDFTGARDYVEKNRRPDEAIVAVGLAGIAYSRYFAPGWLIAQSERELEQVQREHSHLWLVYTIPTQLRAFSMEFWKAIQREFEVVKVFPGTLGDGEIYVCRRRMAIVPSEGAANGYSQAAQRTGTIVHLQEME
jgi:4-amino-4-deoxy-L-arabinose transferase-like glycosyltransferase